LSAVVSRPDELLPTELTLLTCLMTLCKAEGSCDSNVAIVEVRIALPRQPLTFDIRKVFAVIWEASRRLADTVVENKDFEALIRQYDRDDAFFYCDPPYYMTEGHYAVEFLKTDHQRLRDTLAGSKGKWMVSYNDCEFIRELYQDYTITPVTRLSNLAQRYDGGCEYPEVIITNYDPKEREKDMFQMNLFDFDYGGEDEE
jgi:DNA adenine methylase